MNSITTAAILLALGFAPISYAANFGGGEEGTIADGPDATTTFELNVAAHGTTFNFAALHLDLHHTWSGDLTIVLEHDGVSVTLLDRLGVPDSEFGHSGDFNGRYSFVRNGGMSWDPYEIEGGGGIIPEGNYTLNNTDETRLSDFHGQNIHGTWLLHITDSIQADTGFIAGWSMDHFAAPPAPSAVSLFGLAGVLTLRRRR